MERLTIVLTNLTGSTIHLGQPFDSCGASLCVGLREITYTIGWHNISTALDNNTFLVREGPNAAYRRIPVPDKYYNVDVLAGRQKMREMKFRHHQKCKW